MKLQFPCVFSHLNFDCFNSNFIKFGAFLNLSPGYLYKEHGFKAPFPHVSVLSVFPSHAVSYMDGGSVGIRPWEDQNFLSVSDSPGHLPLCICL